MDGLMDELMTGKIEGWMDDGLVVGCMDEQYVGSWMGRCMDR